LKKVERLEKFEDVICLWEKSYLDRVTWNKIIKSLCDEGIPFIETKSGLYVCREDLHGAFRAEAKVFTTA